MHSTAVLDIPRCFEKNCFEKNIVIDEKEDALTTKVMIKRKI